ARVRLGDVARAVEGEGEGRGRGVGRAAELDALAEEGAQGGGQGSRGELEARGSLPARRRRADVEAAAAFERAAVDDPAGKRPSKAQPLPGEPPDVHLAGGDRDLREVGAG